MADFRRVVQVVQLRTYGLLTRPVILDFLYAGD
jgi:hypothetical protein